VRTAGILSFLLPALALVLLGMAPARAGESAIVESVDGVPISYQTGGDGAATVVFVHGWSCDRGYWREQFDRFAEYYRVVAIDLAGHGDSGPGRTDWTIENFGRDVVAVMDALDLQDVVLVGHSMGGPVVLEAALMAPDRVVRVIGIDTLQDPDAPGMSEEQIDGMVAGFEEDSTGPRSPSRPDQFPALSDRQGRLRQVRDRGRDPAANGPLPDAGGARTVQCVAGDRGRRFTN
jgi:pimeloyl-ACP methyl ester carboxylesterase